MTGTSRSGDSYLSVQASEFAQRFLVGTQVSSNSGGNFTFNASIYKRAFSVISLAEQLAHRNKDGHLPSRLGFVANALHQGDDRLTEVTLSFQDIKYTSDYDNPLLRPTNAPSSKSLELEGGALSLTHARMWKEAMLGGGLQYHAKGDFYPIVFGRTVSAAGTILSSRLLGSTWSASLMVPATESVSFSSLFQTDGLSLEEAWIGAFWKREEFRVSGSVDCKNFSRFIVGVEYDGWRAQTFGLLQGLHLGLRR